MPSNKKRHEAAEGHEPTIANGEVTGSLMERVRGMNDQEFKEFMRSHGPSTVKAGMPKVGDEFTRISDGRRLFVAHVSLKAKNCCHFFVGDVDGPIRSYNFLPGKGQVKRVEPDAQQVG